MSKKQSLQERMSLIAKLASESAEGDAEKFDKGNVSAGKRVRVVLKEIKEIVKEAKLLSLNKS